MRGHSRRHGNRAFVPKIDQAVRKELDSAGKVCVFESCQGVLDSSLGFPIVQVMLEFYTLKGSINSIPLHVGQTYWIKSREGVTYRIDTCSPLDRVSDLLIYIEQLVRACRCRYCGVIWIHAQ